MFAPVCLFTYNRLWETQQTIEALKNNFLAQKSDLIIFSDGPKNEQAEEQVLHVRNYVEGISGFKSIKIIHSSENKGLANSIISGVTRVLQEYGKVIVLEDDIVTRPNFLDFINQALDYYCENPKIRSINGYSLKLKSASKEIYFQKRSFPWGWGTWKNRWSEDFFNKQHIKSQIENDKSLLKKFKNDCGDDISKMLLDSLNNVNNSWYVRWVYTHFLTDTFSAYPIHSFVENIGYSDNGTHCRTINSYDSNIIESTNRIFEFIPFEYPDEEVKHDFLFYFSYWSKLMVRFQLLRSAGGREKVLDEIKYKLKLA
ncbi:MAG TPA: glycosyltransferase [Prolixibacteraceae bacterium]|nr:glycosyltransferase [Prolixibacteraceae bacterium]